MSKHKSQGSALLTALFIMTLVAIAATAMSVRVQHDIHRTRLTIDNDKLYLASQAATFWAMSELSAAKPRLIQPKKNGTVMDLPDNFQRIYPGVSIRGGLYDLQSRFNINNLLNRKYQPFVFRLIEKIPNPPEPEQRRRLTMAIYQWISPYIPGPESSNTLNYYSSQKPPYYPANQTMKSISELRLVEGINQKNFLDLSKLLTALPEETAININTTPLPLLKTLGNGLTNSQLDKLVTARGEKGFINRKKLDPLLEKLNIRSDQVTIESKYFLLTVTSKSADLQATFYTVIKRNVDKRGRITVNLISESLNTM